MLSPPKHGASPFYAERIRNMVGSRLWWRARAAWSWLREAVDNHVLNPSVGEHRFVRGQRVYVPAGPTSVHMDLLDRSGVVVWVSRPKGGVIVRHGNGIVCGWSADEVLPTRYSPAGSLRAYILAHPEHGVFIGRSWRGHASVGHWTRNLAAAGAEIPAMHDPRAWRALINATPGARAAPVLIPDWRDTAAGPLFATPWEVWEAAVAPLPSAITPWRNMQVRPTDLVAPLAFFVPKLQPPDPNPWPRTPVASAS
jgi:hypothetical protein